MLKFFFLNSVRLRDVYCRCAYNYLVGLKISGLLLLFFLSANATLVAHKKERKLFDTDLRQIKMYYLKSCHFYFYNTDFKTALQYGCKFCCKAAVARIAIIQPHLVQFSSIPM